MKKQIDECYKETMRQAGMCLLIKTITREIEEYEAIGLLKKLYCKYLNEPDIPIVSKAPVIES